MGWLPALRAWLARGPNQIALSTAARGMIATATPLVVLTPLGHDELAHFAVIGALGISMVDVGGPYRRRLLAMAIASVLGPCLLLAGLRVGGTWWLAAAVMAVLAVGSGLVRAFGPGGVSFGINMSVAFLIGVGGEALGGVHESVWALGYLGGAVWTVLVTLAFWHMRPYRRLEQEVAGAWEAVADLVGAVRPDAGEGPARTTARRRREQLVVQRHRAAREAIERVHDILGEFRAGTSGHGMTMAPLVVLVTAASRVAVAALTLGEIWSAAQAGGASSAARAAAEELECESRLVARHLLSGRGEIDVEPIRRRVAELQEAERARDKEGATSSPVMLAFAQALRNLENTEEAVRLLRDQRRRLPRLLGFSDRAPRRAGRLELLRSHVTLKSTIFRHSLRVAVVSAVCTGVIVRAHLPHGFWLPMTALVVLQPDYGGTWARALQRSAGTVVGSVLSGILLVTLHRTAAYEVAIAVLLFATFFLIRRRYGHAMAFLTPLIILLVGFNGPNPWEDVLNRILYTVLGAAVALLAGYALWPQWEHERLPDHIAAAIRACRDYLVAVLDALGSATSSVEALGPLRRTAEVQVTNGEAAFQRMIVEPSRQRGRVDRLFMLTIYGHRLCRHTIALEAHIGALVPQAGLIAPLRSLVEAGLTDVADALAAGRAPGPRPAFDAPLARLRDAIAPAGRTGGGADLLLGQIVSDISALNTAATAAAGAALDAEIPVQPARA